MTLIIQKGEHEVFSKSLLPNRFVEFTKPIESCIRYWNSTYKRNKNQRLNTPIQNANPKIKLKSFNGDYFEALNTVSIFVFGYSN